MSGVGFHPFPIPLLSSIEGIMSLWVLLFTACIDLNCKVFKLDEQFLGTDQTACNSTSKEGREKFIKSIPAKITRYEFRCVQASTTIKGLK